MQLISDQQHLANLQIVGAVVLGIVVRSGDVAWGGSVLESVQMPRGIVELAREI